MRYYLHKGKVLAFLVDINHYDPNLIQAINLYQWKIRLRNKFQKLSVVEYKPIFFVYE